MTQILTLNPVAAAIMAGMTRLRVNKKSRGGVMYAAIRPSHRVAGRNPMIKVEPVAGEASMVTELTPEIAGLCEGLPELKNNHTYVLFNIGYGWWTLKEPEDANDQTKPLITVTKGRKSKAAPVADTAPSADSGAETPADVKPDAAEKPAEDVKEPVAAAANTAIAEKAAETPAPAAGAESSAAAPTDAVAEFSKSLESAIAANLGEPTAAANAATAETGASADAAETKPAAAAGSAKPARIRTKKSAAAPAAETKASGDGIVVHVIGG